jgi:hypothetical protein
MHNHATLLVSMLLTLFAAFVAAHAGYIVLGFGLFILAVSPVPMAVGFWLRDRVVDAMHRVPPDPFETGRPRDPGSSPQLRCNSVGRSTSSFDAARFTAPSCPHRRARP